MLNIYLVHENEEYGAGGFIHAICTTREKAERVRDWYKRADISIHKRKLNDHIALKENS